MIDASHGIQQQSRLHGFLLNLLGIRQVAVVVNKMDLVGLFRRAISRRSAAPIPSYLAGFGARADFVVPVSARDGDNLVSRAASMPWYEGPTLMEALETFRPGTPARRPAAAPADPGRLQIRRAAHHRRAHRERPAGRGRPPDSSRPAARRREIRTIEGWSRPAPALQALGRGSPSASPSDEQIFIERGELASQRRQPADPDQCLPRPADLAGP